MFVDGEIAIEKACGLATGIAGDVFGADTFAAEGGEDGGEGVGLDFDGEEVSGALIGGQFFNGELTFLQTKKAGGEFKFALSDIERQGGEGGFGELARDLAAVFYFDRLERRG